MVSAVTGAATGLRPESVLGAFKELSEYITGVLDARRAQPREDLHLPDGHLCFAQAQQESDPFHVRRRITALAAGRTRHGCDEAGALVVTQRVRGEARAFGDFGNGEEGCHGNDSES